jgi:uncharacterized membrane protein
MKITRVWLLRITGAMGVFIIVYSLIRHFTGFQFNGAAEKTMFDIIIFAALGLFIYNRRLANDEKKEREAKKRAEAAAERPDEDEEQDSQEQDDRDQDLKQE